MCRFNPNYAGGPPYGTYMYHKEIKILLGYFIKIYLSNNLVGMCKGIEIIISSQLDEDMTIIGSDMAL